MVKKIVFDAQEADGEVDSIDLVLNGQTFTVYEPTSGQITVLLAAFGEDSSAAEQSAEILDFYRGITDTEGYLVIKGILKNPRIPDSLQQVISLTEKVIEAFTGNPTKQPTDYLPSRQSGGQNSTASPRRQASTRSRSPRAASATGSTRSSSRE